MALDQISQAYQDLLGRAPEQAGLDYWTNALNSGTSIDQIRQQFTQSPEYQQRQQQLSQPAPQQPAPTFTAPQQPAPTFTAPQQPAPTFTAPQQPVAQVNPYADQINQFFQTSLNRAPEQAGLDFWSNQITSGAMTPEQVQQAIASSPEAQARSTVTNTFQNYLGRAPEQAGSEYWTNQITSGAMTPLQVAQAIRQSDEGQKYAATPNQAPSDYQNTVNNAFNTYLGRTPEQEGLNYWTDQLVSGALTPEQVTAAIKNSQESQARTAVTDAFNTYLGRTPEQEGLNYWTQQIVSGGLTPEQAALAIKNSDEGDIYNAPQTVKDAYTRWLGRDPEQEGLDYWVNQIKTGALSPEDFVANIRGSQEGGLRSDIDKLYNQYLGRDAEVEGLNYWTNKIKSGEMSWNDLVKNIQYSDEGKTYAEKLYQDKLANPVQYFGDVYARDEQGNLIQNLGSDEYSNLIAGDGYQRSNYGFDTGWRQGENWDQYQNRVNGYYGGAVGKMYEGILGRAVTADELNNIAKQYGGWTSIDLAQVQKDLALSPEAQANAAKNGTWLTLTNNVTTQKSAPWGYNYEVTEPVTKAVYIPPSVAALPSAMKDIYKSDNPQALIDSIKNDPNAYLKQQLIDDARTVGWNMGIINHYRGPGLGIHAWSNPDEYGGDYNAQMTAVNQNAQKTAELLLKNGAMTQDEISNLWKTNSEQAGQEVERGVLNQIHTHGGNGFIGSIANFGDHFGDFLEKYEVAIMASILGGAVLGPLAGAAAEFGGGAALAGATGAGAALPAVSTLPGYMALAGTAGATSTATALATGAPTNKALLAGGLAAAGVGLGGALGPSGLNVAGTLTNLGMPPVLSAVTVGALSGGALGAISGAAAGDIGAGALGGALAGGISSGTNAVTKTFGGMTGTLTRLAAGTAVGMLTGKDISAALQGAAVGTVVGLAGTATRAAIDAAKSGKTDITVDGKITPNPETVDAMRRAAEEELNGMLGNSDPESVKKYVASLPESYFTDAIKAVDTEVANSVKLAAAYPTEAVSQIFKDELGRAPEPEGLKYWADMLRNGDMTLAQIEEGIHNSPEGVKYAALNNGTMTDASGDSAIPQDLNAGKDQVSSEPTLIEKWQSTLTPGEKQLYDYYIESGQSPEQAMRAVDDAVATYNPGNESDTNIIISGHANQVTGSDLEQASPTFWDYLGSIGTLFAGGTSDPNATKIALFGSGASNNPQGGFVPLSFDGPEKKATATEQLIAMIQRDNLSEAERKIAEEALRKVQNAPVKDTKTTGGEKPGSQTLENNQTTGGQTGGGGDSTSKAPSGQPGADAASLGAQAAVEYQAITNKTVTSKQVTDMLNPSSAAAQAASAVVPGSLSIAKIQDDVNVMYNTFLGRAPEKAGLDYWSNAVKSGQLTLAQVASAIANSEEGKAKAASGSGSSSTATSDTGAGTKNTTTDTGTTTAGTGTGTAGTGTNTGTNGTGTGTGGGTGGGAGTGSGTGTGAGTDGTGTGTGTGSSTGSGTGGNGTGTGSGTGSGSGSGGSGGGTGGGSGTGGFSLAQYQQPSLFGLGKGHDIAADVIGGGTKIDLGGRFEAPMLSAMNYAPINYVPAGGLMYATGGLVGYDDETDQNLSADTAGQDSDADIFSGGTAEIDLGGVFKGQPQTYPQQRGYAEGGHVPEFYSEGGLSNRYVNGAGDGTSDDVPAMLATGEFVIPADVVAALGNGSNDAGANVLDELLEVIRQHKQAHDPKELPPDSLGPLAYLNKAMKKAGK